MEQIFYKLYDSFNGREKANIPIGKLPLRIYIWLNKWTKSQLGCVEIPREVFQEVRAKLYIIHEEKGRSDVLIQQNM